MITCDFPIIKKMGESSFGVIVSCILGSVLGYIVYNNRFENIICFHIWQLNHTMFPIIATGTFITTIYSIGTHIYQTDDNPFNYYKPHLKFNKIPTPFSRNLKGKEELLECTFYPNHSIGYWFSDWYDVEIKVEGTQKEWDDFKNIRFKSNYGFGRIENAFKIIRVYGYKTNPIKNLSRLPLLFYIKGPIDKNHDEDVIYDQTIYVT